MVRDDLPYREVALAPGRDLNIQWDLRGYVMCNFRHRVVWRYKSPPNNFFGRYVKGALQNPVPTRLVADGVR